MSSTELKLIDEFLNFKDFSYNRKTPKNQELGPWGTPQGDQDIFCYRKRLEETSALTNKATKKQLKQDVQSPRFNESSQIMNDNTINLSLQTGDPCNTTSSNLLKNKKQLQGLTYQMSQTSQRSDFMGNQENKLYQSAEMDTSYYLKKGIEQMKKKNQSVGRGVVEAKSLLIPASENSTLKYENDLFKIKQVLKYQNESQKEILAQGNTRDLNTKQLETYGSTLALMPESNHPHQLTAMSMIHSNNQTQYNLNIRSKRNINEQRRNNSNDLKNGNLEDSFENNFNKKHFLLIENQRHSPRQRNHQQNLQMIKEQRVKKLYPQSYGQQDVYGNYVNHADPKHRINSIREQLSLFEEGKKKFEKVLKISRLSSMTPECNY